MTIPNSALPARKQARPIRGDRSRRLLSALLLLAGLMLAGCADDDSGRRFANEPIPTEDLASAPTEAPTRIVGRPAGQSATPLPIAQLPAAPGTAAARFLVDDGWLVVVPAAGGPGRRLAEIGSGALLHLEGSPAGDAAAVLTATDAGAPELRVIGADGTERTRVAITVGAGAASPGARAPAGVFDLAWAPDGTRILVALAAGGLVEVSLDGSMRVLLDRSAAPSPRAVAWSPSGSSIAFVDAGPAGTATSLQVASTNVLPIDPVTVVRPSTSQARQIVAIAWVGGSAGILYSQRSADNDLSLGGDLFAVSPTGGAPRLIAAAGGASEVGVVGEFAASADGTVVAYTILGVVNGQAGFHGLWLRQIDGPAATAVAASGWDRVGGLVWTTSGLTWVGELGSGDGAVTGVERLSPSGAVELIYGSPAVATPVASPIASPIGTPISTG